MDSGDSQLQVKFITKQEKYAVSNVPYYVPGNITTAGLNELINKLIFDEQADSKKVEFNFLVNDEILHCKLSEHLLAYTIPTEHDICIEYIEAVAPPEPLDCLEHDDWVSAVHVLSKWILSGCYDNSLHIWSGEKKHKHLLTVAGHSGPIKGVSWVQSSVNENGSTVVTFISASHDQTSLLWEWNVDENTAKPVYIYRGHERSVNCIDAMPSESSFVTGGWDCTLKIWSTDPDAPNNIEESSSKKRKGDKSNAPITRVPKSTLKGHREAISSVQWTKNDEVMSSSWDHTLKIWDAEYGGTRAEVVANKSIFNAHYSMLNNLVVTCGADRHIRLYDARSNQGSIVKKTFSSHKEWVQSVKWSNANEHLFISGSYDKEIKLWDIRSCNTPLFDLVGHTDKVLCCDWTRPNVIISGGADSTLRLFTVK